MTRAKWNMMTSEEGESEVAVAEVGRRLDSFTSKLSVEDGE
jgi:hypothetical protein